MRVTTHHALVLLLLGGLSGAAGGGRADRNTRKYLREGEDAFMKCTKDEHCPQLECPEDSDKPCLQFVCGSERRCVAKDSLPEPCGPNVCKPGTMCCNHSCGICVEPGEGCTKQFCAPPRDPNLRKELPQKKVECQGSMDCPKIACFQAPCPAYACVDHQCVLEEVEEDKDECREDHECPNKDDKCIEGECVFSRLEQPPPREDEAIECKQKFDCPQPRCMAGYPCPSFQCIDYKCVAEYTEPEPEAKDDEQACEDKYDCPQVRCAADHPSCPTYECQEHKCIATYPSEPEPVQPPTEFECKEDYQCPQPACMPGAPCPSYVCENGECVAKYLEEPEAREFGCTNDLQCPQPDCMMGAPCPVIVCEDGDCVEKYNNEEEPVPLLPPPRSFTCSEDFQCPQPSCMIGTPCPFFVCESGECVAKYNDDTKEEESEPVACGPNMCKAGDVCCNASCGTCTAPGGFCTQQACAFIYTKCHANTDCPGTDDECVEGKCRKAFTPQCYGDADCPQPLCAPGAPCPVITCQDYECVEEYPDSMAYDVITVERENRGGDGTAPQDVECKVDDDCPAIACFTEPCPCSVCVEHKCIIQDHV